MKKIIVLGANGQLGQEIVKDLSKNSILLSLAKSDCDITDKELLESCFKRFNPDFVINCAAYTNVDRAEEDMESCYSINHLAVKNIAELSNILNFTFIHFSTDYVFNQKYNKPLVEDDKKGPVNEYGKSKLLGENEILKTAKKYFIFRISWVYGKNGKNFPKTILKLAKKNHEINIINDQIGAPTPTSLVSAVIKKLIGNIEVYKNFYGIYHISPDGECSWYQIANEIFEQINERSDTKLVKINPIKSSDFKTLADRPAYSYLSNKKIKDLFQIDILGWREYLIPFIKEIADE
jgi:dTDP-4-dehydrorhamnose reductase